MSRSYVVLCLTLTIIECYTGTYSFFLRLELTVNLFKI